MRKKISETWGLWKFMLIMAVFGCGSKVPNQGFEELKDPPSALGYLYGEAQAAAFIGTPHWFKETQLLTRAGIESTNPVVTANIGLKMNAATGYRLYVCATTAAATLSGAGSLLMYYWPIGKGSPSAWARNKGLDESVTVTATSCVESDAGTKGCHCQVFPDHVVAASVGGYMYPVANAITVSSGTQVDVFAEVWGMN